MADENTIEEQEKLVDLLGAANEAVKKQIELQSKLSRLKGENLSKAQQSIDKLNAESSLAAELTDILQAKGEGINRLIESQMRYLDTQMERGQIQVESYNKQKALLSEIEQSKVSIEKFGDTEHKQTKEFIDQQKEKLKLLQQELDTIQKRNRAQAAGLKSGAGMVETMGSLIGLKPDLDEGIAGNLFRAADGGEALSSVLRGASSSMGELFSAGNLASFFISNTIELAVRMDQLTTSFVQATGASREFNGEMVSTFKEVSKLGVGLQDTSEAFTGLFVNFTKFSTLGEQTRAQLTATAAGLAKLGVDSRTTGDSLDFLVSGLGMAVGDAESVLKRFATEGRAAGIPPQILAQQFTALEPKLAAFGRQAPEIFMRTAKTAKSLGIEVGELGQNLFQLSEGLSTFDQAADKVASFNLVMGGSFVNAFDLVMAAAEGPFAQLEMLRSGFDAAGKSFDNMNFFEQKMLADSFGISIGNLRAMMEGTLSPQEAMITQEEQFANMVEDASSAVDKLSAAVEQLAAFFAPIGEMFNTAAGAFALFAVPVGLAVAGFSMFNVAIEKVSANAAKLIAGVESMSNSLARLSGTSQMAAASQTQLSGAYGIGNVTSSQAQAMSLMLTGSRTREAIMTQANITEEQLLAAARGQANLTQQQSIALSALSVPAKGKDAVATGVLAQANRGLASSLMMVAGAAAAGFAAFSIFSSMADGMSGTIGNLATGLTFLAGGAALAWTMLSGPAAGLTAGKLMGAAAGIAGAFVGIQQMFKAGAASAGGGNLFTAGIGSPTGGESPVGDMSIPQFRNGGDNITSSFIAGDGPRPNAEFVTPSSVIKAQDSNNLATSLKETGAALRDTRKDDGMFKRMVDVLEKIASNTEEQTGASSSPNINVTAQFGRRKFNKAVADAVQYELSK
jgi:hypothetical protein